MQPPSVQPNKARPLANFLRYWLPVLVWMLLIFSFSSDAKSYHHSSSLFEPLLRWLFPQMSQGTISELHHFFRKTCHLGEYAMLAWLVLAIPAVALMTFGFTLLLRRLPALAAPEPAH